MNAKSIGMIVLAIFVLGCGHDAGLDSSIEASTDRIEDRFAPPPERVDRTSSPKSLPAMRLLAEQKYWQARDAIAPVVDTDHGDATARFMLAVAQRGVGDCVNARRNLSVVLAWFPQHVEAYTQRAICAADMGNILRARTDLTLAERLDPDDEMGFIEPAREYVVEALANVPSKPIRALREELVSVSRTAATDDILSAGVALVKKSNAQRLWGDETYSERRREAAWALAEQPGDPLLNWRLGRLLTDELEVDQHWVESPRHVQWYRWQGTLIGFEKSWAKYYFEQALKAYPGHVPALAGLARLAYKDQRYRDAELYLKRAIATNQPDAEVLYLFRNVMAIASGQNFASYQYLTSHRTWTEVHGNTVYEYTSRPTAAGLRQAGVHAGQVERLMNLSKEYRNKLLSRRSDDARTHEYIGTMAYNAKDWRAARTAYERAVELAPDDMKLKNSLANVYARMNDIPNYLEFTARARNGRHTNAATHLHWAWGQIALGKFDDAREALNGADAADPADPRTFAYRAIIAAHEGEIRDAAAYYTAALSVAEAHAGQQGASLLYNQGRWFVRDMCQFVELRMRLAGLVDDSEPNNARLLYEANLGAEQSVQDTALNEKCYTAIFPDPTAGSSKRPDQPQWGELLRRNRTRLAMNYFNANELVAAHPHFAALPEYDKRYRAMGAKPMYRLEDQDWRSKEIVSAAIQTMRAVGDQRGVAVWERMQRRR